MGREDYEVYKQLRHERMAEAASRRQKASDKDYQPARQLAAQARMVLDRHSDVHYSLESPDGWRLHIYPGNGRLWNDPDRKVKPPFLKMRPDWSLLDLVRAAITASNNMSGFANSIAAQAKPIVTEQDIQMRAYYLWEAAGRPEGRANDFWLQAEHELRG